MKVNQYIKRKKKEKEKEEAGEFEIVDLKNLDNDNKEDKKAEKFKEQYKTLKSQKRISRDKEIFSDFLYRFFDETISPFSSQFSETLGSNYINNFENKFEAIINVTRCKSQNEIMEKIIQLKEFYYGNDGKALSEALLYIREDIENFTKQDMKTYFLSCFVP